MAAPTNALPPLPCLVFGHEGGTTAFCVSDGAHHAFHAEELRGGKRCWRTSSGWVLVCDPSTSATFLWKPLPLRAAMTGSSRCRRCLIRRHPRAARARCPAPPPTPPARTALWYCRAGSGATAWTRHEYDIGRISACFPGADCSEKLVIPRVAACRGDRFYYLGSSTQLGVVDFSAAAGPPAFSVLPVKQVPLRDPGPDRWVEASVYPVDVDGDLHVVFVVHHGPDVETVAYVGVYRMDFARNEFVEVHSIVDRAVVAGGDLGSVVPGHPVRAGAQQRVLGEAGGWTPARV